MRFVRKAHLYLGLALAPMLVFFSVSGAWQTFDLHKTPKGGSYRPPALVETLSNVHTHQQAGRALARGKRSWGFQVLSSAVGAAVAALALLGVVMAFRAARRKWVPAAILSAGVLVPAVLLAAAA